MPDKGCIVDVSHLWPEQLNYLKTINFSFSQTLCNYMFSLALTLPSIYLAIFASSFFDAWGFGVLGFWG